MVKLVLLPRRSLQCGSLPAADHLQVFAELRAPARGSSSPPAAGQQPLGPLDRRQRLRPLFLLLQPLGFNRAALTRFDRQLALARSRLASCRSRLPVAHRPANGPRYDENRQEDSTAAVTARAPLFRRANFRSRYPADGGHACTGSSFK